MSVKTAGVGHFQIPAAPGAGVSVVSGAANNYTTTAIVLSASTSAIYITGVHVETSAALAATYISVGLMIGAGGSETFIGQYLVPLTTASTVALGFRQIFPPIPVANATRLSCKTADSVGAKTYLVSVETILQSNVVDDGIAVGTVTTVTNQLTAAAIATGVWQDATSGDFTVASSIGKSLYIANIAPGASGGHFISGTNAGTTTFGALTVTGATTLTGNVVLSDGLTISAPSTGNRAGLDIAGNGTGAALKLVAGATGVGFSIAGGGTSGDGIKVTTTSGHGVNLAPVGTSMHGLLSTGGNGGTSDGIKAAAGTGGVDFRANQTGNLTGTVATLTTYTGNTPQTGDAFARLGAPAGASVSADVAAVKVDTAAVKVKTDFLPSATAGAAGGVQIAGSNAATTYATLTSTGAFTVNGVSAVSQTGDSFARLGAPAGVSVSADVAAVNAKTTNLPASPASTTNITAGTITTVTNLTNAPTVGDFTAAMKTSIGTAVAASAVASVTAAVTVGTNNDKTGYTLVSGPLDAAGVRSAVGLASANLDTQIGTLATSAQAVAIKGKTDSLTFTTPLQVDVNLQSINDVALVGDGSATPFNV